MSNDLLVKSLALIAFLTLLGGSTYGAYQVIQPEPITPRALHVGTVEAERSVAAGHATSFGLVVRNTGLVDEIVHVSVTNAGDLVAGDPVRMHIPGGDTNATFISLDVPEGTSPGEVQVRFRAETEGTPVRSATTRATVNVLSGAGGLEDGDVANTLFAVRTTDGKLYLSNVPDYEDVPFTVNADFEVQEGELPANNRNLPPVLWERMQGMVEGETRSITLPPEDAFGPKRPENELPRTDAIERDVSFEVTNQTETLEAFAEMLAGSDAGTPDDYAVGDVFNIERGGDAYPFRLLEKTNESVTYRLSPEVGHRFSAPDLPFWPAANEVTAVNETHVSLYLTPTTDVGEPFTFHQYWPNMSAVSSLNETHVVVEHTPEVGFEYEQPVGFQGEVRLFRVERVEEDAIIASYESPNPLAGKTVTFDMHVVTISQPGDNAQQAP